MNKRVAASQLEKEFPEVKYFITDHSISARIGGVRVDIYDDWSIPFLNHAVLDEGVRMASLRDLAAFKLTAFTERREKKDYIDLFFLFQRFGSLPVLLEYARYNPALSKKSLLFALREVITAESNQTEMPDMLVPVSWPDIKQTMLQAAREFFQHIENQKQP